MGDFEYNVGVPGEEGREDHRENNKEKSPFARHLSSIDTS